MGNSLAVAADLPGDRGCCQASTAPDWKTCCGVRSEGLGMTKNALTEKVLPRRGLFSQQHGQRPTGFVDASEDAAGAAPAAHASTQERDAALAAACKRNVKAMTAEGSPRRIEKTHARDLSRAMAHVKEDTTHLQQTLKQMSEVEARLRAVAPKLKAREYVKHHAGAEQEHHELQKEHKKLLGKRERLKQLFQEQSSQSKSDTAEVAALAALVSAEREAGCSVYRTAPAITPATDEFREELRKNRDKTKHRMQNDPHNQVRSFDKVKAEHKDFHAQQKVRKYAIVQT